MSAESADCSSLVVFLEILDRGIIERVAMRPSQYCVYSQQRRGDNQLLKISKMGRSSCCSNEAIKRGAWTNKEDMILRDYIQLHGDGDGWRNLPQKAGLNRCGNSCRLCWVNYLRPGIKRGSISLDEEELIIRMHRLLGNRWSLIAGRLPGRTDKEVKNYWKTHLSKKLSVKDCQFKRPKSPPSLQNHVFIPTPVKVTAALRPSEMVRPNHECSNMLSSPSDYLSDFGFLHTGPATSFGEERNDFEDGNMN